MSVLCGYGIISKRDGRPYVERADDEVCIAQDLIDDVEAGADWAATGEGLFVIYGSNRTVRYRLVGPCPHMLGDASAWQARRL